MTKKRSTTSRLNAVDYLIFIICSLASLAMFYLFYRDMNSFTIKQSEDPIAKIYFKRNTAQRKFLDGDIWEVLTSSSDVYDGDRIRTSNNSEAYTEFSDGAAKIQLNEKSMIQIFQNKNERSINFIGGEIFVESNV
ncbi:MAG: FecR domain-containing protein, partial [Treponema sp.]|nr:FecR domain-containing protein [Treponema sp.]